MRIDFPILALCCLTPQSRRHSGRGSPFHSKPGREASTSSARTVRKSLKLAPMRESGNPGTSPRNYPLWIPAFAGMTKEKLYRMHRLAAGTQVGSAALHQSLPQVVEGRKRLALMRAAGAKTPALPRRASAAPALPGSAWGRRPGWLGLGLELELELERRLAWTL